MLQRQGMTLTFITGARVQGVLVLIMIRYGKCLKNGGCSLLHMTGVFKLRRKQSSLKTEDPSLQECDESPVHRCHQPCSTALAHSGTGRPFFLLSCMVPKHLNSTNAQCEHTSLIESTNEHRREIPNHTYPTNSPIFTSQDFRWEVGITRQCRADTLKVSALPSTQN